MNFDPNAYVVGGVSLIAVVFGLVEFFKDALSLSGKKVTVLAAILGIILMVTYQLQTLIPAPYSQIYEMVIVSLTFGLSASGFYKFVTKLPEKIKEKKEKKEKEEFSEGLG